MLSEESGGASPGYGGRKAKREKFLRPKAKKKRSNPWTFALVIIALAVGVGVGSYLALGGGGSDEVGTRTTVSEPVDYSTGRVEQRPIEAKVEDGYVVISLEEVKKNKLVGFLYPKISIPAAYGSQAFPLLAYIAPSGRLITAVSLCEPCKSKEFHIEPDITLTCNACGTKWELETLKGISGG